MICIDKRNPRAEELALELGGGPLLEAAAGEELVLVLGGDGFMLRCIHGLGFDKTYLGLNAGTLGFLLNDVTDARQAVNLLEERRYQAHAFPVLQARVTPPDGPAVDAFAMNDVSIERSSGQVAQLRITVNGVEVVERLAADGVVVATSLGSTAYSFSAGGPPCHPLVPATHLTPICPHTPRLSPLTLPVEAAISIEALAIDRRPVRVFADGRDLGAAAALEITPSQHRVRLAFFEGHQFTQTLVRKVLGF